MIGFLICVVVIAISLLIISKSYLQVLRLIALGLL